MRCDRELTNKAADTVVSAAFIFILGGPTVETEETAATIVTAELIVSLLAMNEWNGATAKPGFSSETEATIATIVTAEYRWLESIMLKISISM